LYFDYVDIIRHGVYCLAILIDAELHTVAGKLTCNQLLGQCSNHHITNPRNLLQILTDFTECRLLVCS